jgi:hypothetical protein
VSRAIGAHSWCAVAGTHGRERPGSQGSLECRREVSLAVYDHLVELEPVRHQPELLGEPGGDVSVVHAGLGRDDPAGARIAEYCPASAIRRASSVDITSARGRRAVRDMSPTLPVVPWSPHATPITPASLGAA